MRNRVPSQAACAPSANTAATPRASPMPPAAITGTGATASTTADTSGRVATVPHTWPPASPALGDDDVYAGGDGSPRLLRAADGEQDDSPGIVDGLDVLTGISPDERDDPQAGLEGLVEAAMVVFAQDEVAAERPRGPRRRITGDGSDVLRPGERHHAERAGVGDRGGQAGDRRHGRLDDGVLDAEQLAHRRAHRPRSNRSLCRPFEAGGTTAAASLIRG